MYVDIKVILVGFVFLDNVPNFFFRPQAANHYVLNCIQKLK